MNNIIDQNIKNRLMLALDVDTIDEAKELVDLLNPYFGTFKVGLQLFCQNGIEIIKYIKEKNSNFFMDVKLHDIANTIERASYNIVKNGASFFNVHAFGSIEMMKSAKKGALIAARDFNLDIPKILAVTVLTSIDEKILNNELMIKAHSSDLVLQLALNAKIAGLDGVVASANEIKLIKKELGDDFIVLTPGIRPKFSINDEQKRTATPKKAFCDGADYIVLGRAITKANDKIEAIKKVYSEIQGEND